MRQLLGNGFGQLGSTIKPGVDAPSEALGADRSAKRLIVSFESNAEISSDSPAFGPEVFGLDVFGSEHAEIPSKRVSRPVRTTHCMLVIFSPRVLEIQSGRHRSITSRLVIRKADLPSSEHLIRVPC
jgi:hypothetical protein